MDRKITRPATDAHGRRLWAGLEMEDTMHDYYLVAAFFCWMYLVTSLVDRRMPIEW